MKMMMAVAVAAWLGAGCGKVDKGAPAKAGETEAMIQLDHLAKNAKAYYVEHGAYPTGTEAPTPAQPCCSQPGKRCKPIEADWNTFTAGHPWTDLKFSMPDEFRFQYSYTGTADAFTATAIGDPDCDGNPMVVTATGSAANGNPVVTISNGPTR